MELLISQNNQPEQSGCQSGGARRSEAGGDEDPRGHRQHDRRLERADVRRREHHRQKKAQFGRGGQV